MPKHSIEKLHKKKHRCTWTTTSHYSGLFHCKKNNRNKNDNNNGECPCCLAEKQKKKNEYQFGACSICLNN